MTRGTLDRLTSRWTATGIPARVHDMYAAIRRGYEDGRNKAAITVALHRWQRTQ